MVITLDKNEKPLGFVTERRARILREKKRADIVNVYPPVIRINDVDADKVADTIPEFRIKIDPGTEWTGLAIVRETDNAVVWYGKIHHRGYAVHEALQTRATVRHNRRNRELWFRKNKFWSYTTGPRNSGKQEWKKGKLVPSVKSVQDNVIHWVEKLKGWIPLTKNSFEACRFDTQQMDNPDIEGTEYQQGSLFGYEMKEYLMEKYRHTCQYCGGKSGDSILEWEHMMPKSRGGPDSLKNAMLACHRCNHDKNNRTVQEYLELVKKRAARKEKPSELDEARIKGLQNVLDGRARGGSNRYAAWANILRRYEERLLFQIFGDVECSSGGRTKYNRTKLGLPKDHHYDALCVGEVPEGGYCDLTNGYVLTIEAVGRGTRFRGKINACGVIIQKLPPRPKRLSFPDPKGGGSKVKSTSGTRQPSHALPDVYKSGVRVTIRDQKKRFRGILGNMEFPEAPVLITKVIPRQHRSKGFQNGDIVKVDKKKGKGAGRHIGRVMVRASGYFDIRTLTGDLVTAKHTDCTIIQRQSGYQFRYSKTPTQKAADSSRG